MLKIISFPYMVFLEFLTFKAIKYDNRMYDEYVYFGSIFDISKISTDIEFMCFQNFTFTIE